MTRYSTYLYKAAGTRQISDLIQGTEINHSTMSRYLSGERKLPVAVVVAMSEKYDVALLDGMVAAEYITEAQAQRERERYAIGTMSDQDLAAEVLRRLDAARDAQVAAVLEQPIDEPLPEDVPKLSDRRRRVTAADVTPEDLMGEAAYTPEDGETPDRDSY